MCLTIPRLKGYMQSLMEKRNREFPNPRGVGNTQQMHKLQVCGLQVHGKLVEGQHRRMDGCSSQRTCDGQTANAQLSGCTGTI